MNRRRFLEVGGLAVTAGVIGCGSGSNTGGIVLAASDWPTYNQNSASTGAFGAALSGSLTNAFQTSLITVAEIAAPPIVGPVATRIYLNNGELRAFDLDASATALTPAWLYPTPTNARYSWVLATGGSPAQTFLYGCTIDGQLNCLREDGVTVTSLWAKPGSGLPCFGTLPNRIYVGSAGSSHVNAYNASTGALSWRASVPAEVDKLTSTGGVLYAVASDSKVYALKETDGSRLWTSEVGETDILVGPGNTVYFGKASDLIQVSVSGEISTAYTVPNSELIMGLALSGSSIYLLSNFNRDNIRRLYKIDINTRTLVWSETVGGASDAWMLTGKNLCVDSGNNIYAVGNGGILYRIADNGSTAAPAMPLGGVSNVNTSPSLSRAFGGRIYCGGRDTAGTQMLYGIY